MNSRGTKMENLTDDEGTIETEEIILTSVHDILVVVKAWCEADARKDSAYEGRVQLVDFCVSQLERLLLPTPDQFD
tara:strand:- start:170 stop:397 length:228 start_codon:yes stop_codon:yes gene_type:complete